MGFLEKFFEKGSSIKTADSNSWQTHECLRSYFKVSHNFFSNKRINSLSKKILIFKTQNKVQQGESLKSLLKPTSFQECFAIYLQQRMPCLMVDTFTLVRFLMNLISRQTLVIFIILSFSWKFVCNKISLVYFVTDMLKKH